MPDEARGSRRRQRLSVVLLVIAGFLLPIGLISTWANNTFYDSNAFSRRSVDLLNSEAVRTFVAGKLTDQLAQSGNTQALNVRPAFILAMEAVVDTDTFKSIFRTAVRKTHQALLAGKADGATLDLSESVDILASTAQLPENARPGKTDKPALGRSLDEVTTRLADLHVWQLEDWTAEAGFFGIGGAFLAAAGAIALAADRRRTLQRVGWLVVAVGIFIVGAVLALQWYAGSLIDDPGLSAAVHDGLSRAMGDVRSIGLWTAGYGVIIAAAARAGVEDRFTPAKAASAATGWVERRRATRGGTVILGAAAILAGITLVQDPTFWLRAAVLATGLWLAYFGVTELLRLVHTRIAAAAETDVPSRSRRRGFALTGAVVVLLVALVSGGLILANRGHASRAEAAGVERCNGEHAFCGLRIDQVAFPGTHNSMSSAAYPNWLFPEHFQTIGGQLQSGARALLFDTHYGVPSSARFPGSDRPLIITDRASELEVDRSEGADPALKARAAELAGRAPAKAGASRGIYLCHNYCEMGAITFASALEEIRAFIETHPDDVVSIVIEDHTASAETAAAIEASGLGDEAYTLDPSKPLPTLGELIRSRRNLLVFAESDVEPGVAPPWYQSAYGHWFQETTYSFREPEEMDCAPNRGRPDAPLFLVNHWLLASPPDPKRAASVNSAEFLESRIRRCLDERGLLPNVVAVDFSEHGDVRSTARRINQGKLGEEPERDPDLHGLPAPTTTSVPSQPPVTEAAPPSPGPELAPHPVLSTLTGGDPVAFCARLPTAYDIVASWAIATIAARPGEAGLADLAYGAAGSRALDGLLPTAPEEIARQTLPIHQRARAAVQALRDLGVDDATIASLADIIAARAPDPANDDPFSIQTDVLGRLRAVVGDEKLTAAGQSFAAAHPVSGVFYLGEVPDDVARASGYACLVSNG